MAVYLGETDEDKIDNMSFLFFEDVVATLGKRLTYDAVVNYAGNSFFEKSWEVITENNPFNVKREGPVDKTGIGHMIDKLNMGAGKIKII